MAMHLKKNVKNQCEMDKRISEAGFMAVSHCKTENECVLLAKRLVSKGIFSMEIPYRGEENFNVADKCIRAVRESVPEMLIGGATAINPAIARRAVRSGAHFVISPGFNIKTVQYCIHRAIPIYPGVATPSEIENALLFGLTTLKFFPAHCLGGVKTLSSLLGPFPNVRFIVSGGLNAENCQEYKNCKNVAAVSGSWLSE